MSVILGAGLFDHMRCRKLSSNTMATWILARVTIFEMVPNRTHCKRRNGKNGHAKGTVKWFGS
jgi:hypothetical protein